MAKLTGKHWYDALEWSARNPDDTVTIFGHHFPNVKAIHVYHCIESDSKIIRWRNKSDDLIHEYKIEPEWAYDEPTTQIQALLVSIRMS